MLLDEIEYEGDSHFGGLSHATNGALHATLSTPTLREGHRLHRQRSSIGDLTFLKIVENVQTSIHDQLRKRLSIDHSNGHENPSQLQFVSEQREDDAIVKIFHKRLLPSTNHHDDNQSNLIYTTVKVYQLYAGTLEKIIEYLTDENGELDRLHMHILFSTYRIYTNTKSLIDKIVQRYLAVLPASLEMTEAVRSKTIKSLARAMSFFLKHYSDDLHQPPDFSTLNSLLQQVAERTLRKQCKQLLEEFVEPKMKISEWSKNPLGSSSSLDHDIHHHHHHLRRRPSIDYFSFNQYTVNPHFLDMSNTTIAEQLTVIDARLFQDILLYQCLTANHRDVSSTVYKTIEQSNAVTYRVIATILHETDEHIRARLIEKWIDIAQECRRLRNLSSITAILNGLNSESIYRLQRTQSHVKAASASTLKKLYGIFGGPNIREQSRNLLDKRLEEIRLAFLPHSETSMKYSEIFVTIEEILETKNHSKQIHIHGTIPYLGLYLEYLTGIDEANQNSIEVTRKDRTKTKLIHFDKYRKTFEILAQLQLFQISMDSYWKISPCSSFRNWFDSLEIYSEDESWNRSCEVEPNEPVVVQDKRSSQEDLLNSSDSRAPVSTGSFVSLPSLDSISVHSFYQRQKSQEYLDKNHSQSSSRSSSSSRQRMMFSLSEDQETLKVIVYLSGRSEENGKTIHIKNNDRATTVLKNILIAYTLDPSTYERYCIEQRLPGQNIILPHDCNVFYALKRSSNDDQIELIIREKPPTPITADPKKTRHHHRRTPSVFSISSTQSR